MASLKIRNLVKSYRSRKVVNRVTLEIKQGEIIGLLGPNGAGKTTTFYMVVGLTRPDDGQVFLNDEDITIYGDGNQTRSFCYVDDLIRGFLSFMEADKKITGPINLGNPDEIKIFDLASKIINLTKSKYIITNYPLPADDPMRRRPNIDLASESINWNPNINLITGLKKTIDYFKKEIT